VENPLHADDPARARAEVDRAMAGWSRGEIHLQHYYALVARVQADLYERRGDEAVERLAAEWSALRGAFVFRVQLLRLQALHVRARSAVVAAAAHSSGGSAWARLGRDRLIAAAERDAGRIERERRPWATALALLVRGGAAASRGQRRWALALLERAGAALDDNGMRLWSSAAARQRGILRGGAEGRALVERADAAMAAELVRDPARLADMLVPVRLP